MKYSADKDIHRLVRELVGAGWSYGRGARHGRLRAPAGLGVLTVPNTPSDRRAFLNFRQDVRRMLRPVSAAPAPRTV